MTIIWFCVGLLLIVIGVVCVGGALLPRDHVATGSVVVPASREAVWAVVRDPTRTPSWRPDVTKVDSLVGDPASPSGWTEHMRGDAIPLVVERVIDGELVETRIADDSLAFGGTWTIELSREAAGTRVRITERGYVKPAPFRFVARFLFGHNTTLRAYLRDLNRRFEGSSPLEG